MFGSTVLEVAVCLVFIYLLISLICTTINEWIASAINMRGKTLLRGIKNLLNDPKFQGLSQQLYCHGLVAAISKDAADPEKTNRLPSYMPARTFAIALLDILAAKNVSSFLEENIQQLNAEITAAQEAVEKDPKDQSALNVLQCAVQLGRKLESLKRSIPSDLESTWHEAEEAASKVDSPKDFEKLQEATEKFQQALDIGRIAAADLPDPLSNISHSVKKLSAGHTKESLLVILANTKRAVIASSATPAEQMQKLQANIEAWFNDAMDRIGGWYKRWTQVILLIIAFVLVFAVNADTLLLAKRFTSDTAFRASVVALAQKESAQSSIPKDFLNDAQKLTLPIGWLPEKDDKFATDQVPNTVSGWLFKLLGLLITIAAVSLGAPFWFDTLSKFVNLRGAGTPPGETTKSAPQPEVKKGG
jgi:hypothetical protein